MIETRAICSVGFNVMVVQNRINSANGTKDEHHENHEYKCCQNLENQRTVFYRAT
jgi:hypothetical protein